ncbi:hypothetical protein VTL71DRAFT_12080 [Oculimacula yallundae]|uniref:Uncharacterized protein n=1 Tax=Oculimacula yallundae TaxID=86028 RepID=A0ABR4CT37_9HELO
MEWSHTRALSLVQNQLDFNRFKNSEEATAADISLAALWVLADKLKMPRLQNQVMTIFHRLCEDYAIVPLSTFHYIYENTSMDSSLRKFVVRLCVTELHESVYKMNSADFPQEMMFDIAQCMAGLLSDVAWDDSVVITEYYVNTKVD